MNEVMTWAEIEAKFDGEWVLIEDPETTPSHEIISGKVIFHSSSREEIHESMMALPRLSHAVLFIGKQPRDVAFAL